MEFNRLVFPQPPASYTAETFKGKLIYIPKFQLYAEPKKKLIDYQNDKSLYYMLANKRV